MGFALNYHQKMWLLPALLVILVIEGAFGSLSLLPMLPGLALDDPVRVEFMNQWSIFWVAQMMTCFVAGGLVGLTRDEHGWENLCILTAALLLVSYVVLITLPLAFIALSVYFATARLPRAEISFVFPEPAQAQSDVASA
ncbi:MAG: hypothetical protein HXY34_03835 [Candidatus Thorarchaeota archaeon]|nr:hypothetical protein [Candidatus Thorarchaeota archaeon]